MGVLCCTHRVLVQVVVNIDAPCSHGAKKGDGTDEDSLVVIWFGLFQRSGDPFALFAVFTPVALLLGLRFCSLLHQFVILARYRAEK